MAATVHAPNARQGASLILTNSRMTQSALWRESTRSVASGAGEHDFAEAVRLFGGRARSGGVVVLGARAALVYGCLTRAFGRIVPWAAKEVFLDAPSSSPLLRMKRALQRWAFAECAACIVYSRAEVPRCIAELGVSPEQCVFVPFHTRIPPEPGPLPGDGPLLAAGRSLRDFRTLAAAARAYGGPLEVIAPAPASRFFDSSGPVRFLGELSGEEYSRRLRGCRGVVVSLTPGVRSAGQAVVLEAMALGKPALVSRSPGIVDYVVPGVTCLMHEPGDAEGLGRDMARLASDGELCRKLGSAALEHAARFTPDAHARAVLQLLAPAGRWE